MALAGFLSARAFLRGPETGFPVTETRERAAMQVNCRPIGYK
jgi:hypothetical protein